MRAVDTNVLVRVISRDEPVQVAAAERFTEEGAWVSTLVLAEAMWVLRASYGLSATELCDAIEMLLNHRDFVLQDPEAVVVALELFREKPALGFSDCLIIGLARQAGHLPLGTFDRNLYRLEGAHKL
jgi:predicted nucleic-acid-binding protein